MVNKLFSLAKSKIGPVLTELGFATPLRNFLTVKKVFQDDQVMAFYHPKPFWEIHIVIVPTHKIAVLGDVNHQDSIVMGYMCEVAANLVNKLKLDQYGYRLITNGGKYQKVKYLHFHLGAGKQLQIDEDGSKNSTPIN